VRVVIRSTRLRRHGRSPFITTPETVVGSVYLPNNYAYCLFAGWTSANGMVSVLPARQHCYQAIGYKVLGTSDLFSGQVVASNEPAEATQ
jgi:hypothetical protein